MEIKKETSCCKLPYYGENHNPVEERSGMTVCRHCNHVHNFSYGTFQGPAGQMVSVWPEQLIEANGVTEQFVEVTTPASISETVMTLKEVAYMLAGFKYVDSIPMAAEPF